MLLKFSLNVFIRFKKWLKITAWFLRKLCISVKVGCFVHVIPVVLELGIHCYCVVVDFRVMFFVSSGFIFNHIKKQNVSKISDLLSKGLNITTCKAG